MFLENRMENNFEKLNEMINEFKGCVSIARAALVERKGVNVELRDEMRDMIAYVKSLARNNQKKMNSLSKIIDKIAKKLDVSEKKSRKNTSEIVEDVDERESVFKI